MESTERSLGTLTSVPPARPTDHQIRKTISVSFKEGIFAQIYLALSGPGSIFVTKYAVFLNATPFQLGILSAIGQMSQIFQPIGAIITHRLTSRRKLVITIATLARILTFLFGLCPFVFMEPSSIWFFLSLFFIVTSMLAISGNAWIAWISDMIPLRYRGRFFSHRTQYLMLAGLMTGYFFGAVIDIFDFSTDGIFSSLRIFLFPDSSGVNSMPWVFLIIFFCAGLAGLISSKILAGQPELPKYAEESSIYSMVITPLKDKNFQKLLVYGFWWMFVVGIGSPFWQPFMIQKLKMSLVDIQIYGTISTLASLLVLKPWGVFIDRFGNKAAMALAIILGGLNPLVWVFTTLQHHWFVYFEAATSGIMWAGAGIVSMNFVLAIAPSSKRQIYSGLFGALTGIAMMITMLFSGACLPSAITIGGWRFEPEQVLFAMTGVLRWSTLLPLSWIDEARGRPMGEVIYYIRQFAKVRIEHLAERIVHRGNSKEES